ncbi:MAG: hypothetical protein NTY19_23560 [Planctomycetota bacterium]|nr:hypothetical protein [Planctomycetota bacterium]
MSDQLFLAKIDATGGDAGVLLAIRNAMAESCALHAESIYDDDECDTLCSLSPFGWDPTPLQCELERLLGTSLPDELAAVFPIPGGWKFIWWDGGIRFLRWKRENPNAVTFGGWAKAILLLLRERGLIG